MGGGPADPAILRSEQYATGANLSARIALHRRFRVGPVAWHDWLFERMSIRPAARILELGCGTGLLWRALADRVSSDWSVVLTDFSEGMLREARRVTSTLACRVHAAVADAGAVPFPDASVDVVVANHMLYHVPDRDRALQEIRRVLDPGGVLYATTIGTTYLHQLEELVAAYVPQAPSLREGVLSQFGEKTGLEQLRRWFPRVDTEAFDEELHVTDADAVGDYIRSTGTWHDLSPPDLERILAAVRRQIEREGAFVLDARSVFFACESPP
jgi:ubiquinone/menaquinone biosynthesis C-methylase UbiE